MNRIICTYLFAILVVTLSFAAEAAGLKPQPCQLDEQYLLGVYIGNGESLMVRESGGKLALLYRYSSEDKDYRGSNLFPLRKEHYDAYALQEAGPMTHAESTVKFERDKEGNGISLRIGGHSYTRRFLPGEKGIKFLLKSNRSWEELVKEAAASVMPKQTEGAEAELVNLATIEGLRLELRYATNDNCFGHPLVDVPKAYLDKGAAAALERVQKELAAYGYGLIVWEAYRPWKAFKLATLALPKGQEALLPKAEQCYSHNTGRSVDVSLYALNAAEPVPMPCDFDMPTPAQYPHYMGGTDLARWNRNLLQQLMEKAGFSSGKDEWWHFTYQQEEKYRFLDIPLSELE